MPKMDPHSAFLNYCMAVMHQDTSPVRQDVNFVLNVRNGRGFPTILSNAALSPKLLRDVAQVLNQEAKRLDDIAEQAAAQQSTASSTVH